MDSIREAETGEAVRRLARRGDGSASPRRGRGSMLARGVLWDGQFPGRGRQSPENAQFWAGSRQGNVEGATRRRDRSCPQGAARTGCRRRRRTRQLDVSRKAPTRRTSDRLFSCHLSEVSDHAVATDWYEKYRAARRRRRRRQGRAISATRRRRNRSSRFSGANSGFSASTACATRASRSTAAVPASSANKVLVNQRMKRAGMRWSIKGGQNVLTIVDAVGPFRTGMATGAANEDQVPDAIAA